MARPRAIFHHVGAGTAQIPDGLLLDGRDTNGDQLAGAVQPGQPPAVTLVGLDLVTWRFGDQRRRDHLAADAMLCNSRASSNPVGPAS